MRQMSAAFAVLIITALQPYYVAQAARVNQPNTDNMILQRTDAKVRAVEPQWRFVSGICSCPPLMDEQIGVLVGTWEQPGDGSSIRRIEVRVHAIANADAAARWIDRTIREKLIADGWSIARYESGDGGYTSTYRDGRRYEVTFRKGRFLGFVSGESEIDVHRFAGYLLAAMPRQGE